MSAAHSKVEVGVDLTPLLADERTALLGTTRLAAAHLLAGALHAC